jgi:hypothetical protein
MAILDLDNHPDSKGSTKPTAPVDNGPGPIESGIRGFANAATFGLAPQIGALSQTLMGNGSYSSNLKQYLDANRQAEASHPVASLAGSAVPSVIQALATGGGSLARQGAVNAGMGAVNALGSSDLSKPGQAVKDAATGAAVGGALGTLPGAAFKGANKLAESYTRNVTADAVENLIKKRPPGYKAELENIFGKFGTTKELTQAGKDYVSAIKDTSSKGLSPRDVPEFARAAAPLAPSWGQIGRDAATTVKEAAIGGGLGAGANYITGGNLDPTAAVIGGAALGGQKALRNVGNEVLSRGAIKMATSEVPEKIMEAGASRLGGAANQLLTQSAEKDLTDRAGGSTSPFGKLSDYLSAVVGDNPDSKRKAAMQLQSTPEGRAVGNVTSPFRDLDQE